MYLHAKRWKLLTQRLHRQERGVFEFPPSGGPTLFPDPDGSCAYLWLPLQFGREDVLGALGSRAIRVLAHLPGVKTPKYNPTVEKTKEEVKQVKEARDRPKLSTRRQKPSRWAPEGKVVCSKRRSTYNEVTVKLGLQVSAEAARQREHRARKGKLVPTVSQGG
jgi:hypothetical protein